MGFQVLLYKGSHVPLSHYTPLVESLNHRLSDLNATVTVGDYSLFHRNTFSDDTILVGHSFGGYFALLDAVHDQDRSKKLDGVVLLHSHFNSRKSAWYPKVSQEKVRVPVLTIAGGRDQRLPIKKVLPDLWQKNDEHLADKFYKVYPNFSHFSGLSGKPKDACTEMLAHDIEVFVRSVRANKLHDVQRLCRDSEHMFSYRSLASKVPKVIDYKNSTGLLDALLKIVLKYFFWDWLHHIAFLADKPTPYKNVVYTDYGDHVLIKSYDLSLDEVMRLCRDSLPESYKTRFEVVTLPTNLWGLYQWLLFPLALRVGMEADETIRWPILHLPVKDRVNYYKFIHPRQLILKKIEKL
jgi:hypothetical protein